MQSNQKIIVINKQINSLKNYKIIEGDYACNKSMIQNKYTCLCEVHQP